MRRIVLVLALSCSGCHACVAAMLAEDEPTESTDPAAKNAPPTATAATPATATATATATAKATATATATATARPPSGSSAGVAGRYECFQMRVTMSANGYISTTFVPGALPGFTIDGTGGYTSSGKPGSVNASASDAQFIGGPYDGWRGATGSNSTGFYLRFSNKTPGDPRVGDTAKSGDYLCYRQRS